MVTISALNLVLIIAATALLSGSIGFIICGLLVASHEEEIRNVK